MKRQTLHLIEKSIDKKALLSAGILTTVMMSLSVNAQSSFLPPEVIPVNQAVSFSSPVQNINSVPGLQNAPAQISQVAQTMQTPQEARQALYHSLMGNNNYPQFNDQTTNQGNTANDSNAMNTNQGMPGQNSPQNWTNQFSHQDNSTLAQNNNASPAQSQTLSGNVATQATSQQRTTGGISRLTSVVTGMGMNLYALAGMRSPGGAYSAGLLGTGMMNYGLRSGFRF